MVGIGGRFTAATVATALVLVAVPAGAPGHGTATTPAASTVTVQADRCEGQAAVSLAFEHATERFLLGVDDEDGTNLVGVYGNLDCRTLSA
jgi:hypothetical protein